MMSDERDCSDCIHKKIYDDGGGRWDIWCNEDGVEGQLDDEFDDSYAKHCPHFTYDQGMMH